MIKQGFYCVNDKAGINADINNLENDFIIIFGFRLESEELEDVSLFELYQNQKSQIKIYLSKNYNRKYELYVEDDKNMKKLEMKSINISNHLIYKPNSYIQKPKMLYIHFYKTNPYYNIIQ